MFKGMFIAFAAVIVATCNSAKAQDIRSEVLEFYPCAEALSTSALEYLRDWSNATKNDPCMLEPAEFASIFGFPMAQPRGQISQSAYEMEALSYIESYFAVQPAARLFLYQTLMMNQSSADGRWGPETSTAFAETLDMYTAIGGSGEDWGILGEHHVPRFLRWIEEAAYASTVGAEFPD